MFSVNAIVLRSFMFGDTKMMADVFSREEGRMSCVLRTGSRTGKLRRQMFQPMSILELSLERKSPGALAVVKDAHIGRPFSSIPFHPYKLSISMFLAEFLCGVLKSEQNPHILFDYVCEGILWLDGVKSGFSNFHLVFLMRLTRFVGFYPNTENYRDGYCFDMQNGCFVEAAPSVRGFLNAEETRALCALMRMDYGNMSLFGMSHAERNRCLDAILYYYRLHLPGTGELKSLPVLRELFA